MKIFRKKSEKIAKSIIGKKLPDYINYIRGFPAFPWSLL